MYKIYIICNIIYNIYNIINIYILQLRSLKEKHPLEKKRVLALASFCQTVSTAHSYLFFKMVGHNRINFFLFF